MKNIATKRIEREINILYKNNIIFGVKNMDDYNNPVIICINIDNINYEISFTNNFPFSSPNIYIILNNSKINYIQYYYNIFNRYQKYSFKKGIACPCCYNKCCNWQLNFSVLDLINEIKEFNEQINIFKNKELCELILFRLNIYKDINENILDYI